MSAAKPYLARMLAFTPKFSYLAPGDKYLFAPETPRHKFNVIGVGVNGQEHIRVTLLEGRADDPRHLRSQPVQRRVAPAGYAQFVPRRQSGRLRLAGGGLQRPGGGRPDHLDAQLHAHRRGPRARRSRASTSCSKSRWRRPSETPTRSRRSPAAIPPSSRSGCNTATSRPTSKRSTRRSSAARSATSRRSPSSNIACRSSTRSSSGTSSRNTPAARWWRSAATTLT